MKRFIFSLCCLAAAGTVRAQNLAQVQYFLDTDPGFGQTGPYSVVQALSAGLQVPDTAIALNPPAAFFAGVAPGPHLLYCRVQASNGQWSHTARRRLELVRLPGTAKVTAVEYFFGTDPGVGQGTRVVLANPAIDGTYTFNIPTSQLTTGTQKLYARAWSEDSAASQTASRSATITISNPPPPPPPPSGVAAVLDDGAFTVAPNPASNRLTLSFATALPGVVTVTVLDAIGKAVVRTAGSGARIDVPLPALPAGQYLLRLDANGASATRPITLLP